MVLVIVNQSVCPSVCLSHSWTVPTWFNLISLLYSSTMILVFWRQIWSPHFNGITFKYKVKYEWGRQNVVFSSIKQLVSRKQWVIRRKLLQNSTSYTSFRLVPRSMTLSDIWKLFKPMLSVPRPISRRKLYAIRPQKLKLPIRNYNSFRWYDCRWPWRYFKEIRLFHIKCLVNGAWYCKSYYRVQTTNRKSYTSFRLVPPNGHATSNRRCK